MEQHDLINLIEKCRAGDPDAQEKLVIETQNKVYYHCKKFLKNEEDAQDAAQDVLIAMITSLDKLREPAAFWGWVSSITARRCKYLLSRGTREWQIPEDEEGNSMLDSIETLDEQTVPDKALDNDETQRLIMKIIDDLPPEQRMTVTFFYFDEMSVKTIAEIMQVSEGTVKSRLNYARKSIKNGVEQLEKRDGTKLYSVSLLPFLAYFLRREAQSQALSPAAAQALTQRTLAEAGTAANAAAGAGTAAAAEAETVTTVVAETKTVAAAPAGAEAAAAVKTGIAGTKSAAGAASAKIVAAVLAGVLAVGGIGGGVYLMTHREETPADQPVSEPVHIEEPAGPDGESSELDGESPEPGAGSSEIDGESSESDGESSGEPIDSAGQDYAAAYAQKVQELAGNFRYGLVYIDKDAVPELIASTESEDMVNVYTIDGGELRVIREEWRMGRMGVPLYYPGMNVIREDYSTMSIDHMETSHIFFHINDAYEVEEFFRQDGEHRGDGRDKPLEVPEELQNMTPEPLLGTLDAQEMLELLETGNAPAPSVEEPSLPEAGPIDLDFSPYTGTYEADPKMIELYSIEEITELTLSGDGALTGGEETYSWSGGLAFSCIASEGAPPIQLLSGSESKGGPGSYTLMLYKDSMMMAEGDEILSEEYYILYPAGVPDDRGGDSSKVRIFYADLTGGAWEMLFTKTS